MLQRLIGDIKESVGLGVRMTTLAGESFSGEDVVGPPTYTRPALWDGEEVPGVLLSGDHAKIRAWRESEARERTRARTSGRMPP